MNILHIIAAPASGGAEAMVRDLAIAQRKLGHEAVIAFLDRAEDLGRDPVFEVKFLESLTQMGVRFCFIGHDARRMPWRGWLRLRQVVKQYDIDILHTHLFYGVMFAALLRIPVVYTHHSENSRFSKLQYRILDRIVERCIGISEACASNLRRNTKRPVTQISNGVDTTKFAGKLREAQSSLKFVTLGRITELKDHGNLVEAIRLLPSAARSIVQIDLYGEGDESAERDLRSKISDAEIKDNLILRGVTNKIPDVLAQSEIFLLSSKSEGLPIALLEAIASGLPCIVTDVGGCGETVREFNNGIVVPPQNAAQLSEAIMTAMNKPALVATWSQNSLEAREKIDIIQKARQHLVVYRKAGAAL